MDSYYEYEDRPAFYRRWWFVSMVVLSLLIVSTGAYLFVTFIAPLRARAAEFDLALMREMESATLILDRKEQIMGRIFVQNRDTVPLHEFPRYLLQAVIAAEDNRFYKHRGVDFVGLARAFIENYKAEKITQGGSTLTMQLARNSFSLREKSYERKLVEVFLSRRIEREMNKNLILELYLNRVYYGAGFYGAEAAARGYFGKGARELTLSESAILAGLLKSPNNLSPWSDRRASIESRNVVLRRMLQLEMISSQEYQNALAEDPDVKTRKPISGESYVIDFIRQQVIDELGFEAASSEGFRVYTTIDPRIQTAADNALRERLTQIEKRPQWEHETYEQYENYLRKLRRSDAESAAVLPDYLQGSLITVDNQTGAILALSGGRDFKHSEYNRALLAKRPPGTAFKPLVYAAAFEKGMFPGTPVEDAVMDNRQVMIGGTTGILGEWGPESEDNRFEGTISARQALVMSKNAATVRLGMQTGLEEVIAFARASGISTELRPFPATLLGSSEVTLADLTLAFTQFAKGGWRPKRLHVIQRIENKAGETVYSAKMERKQVMRATAAFEVHTALEEVLEIGTADRARTELGLKHFPAGGKTGTAYNFTDNWFIGYNSSVTTGVWVGFDKPRTIYRGAFSKDTALPVWVDVMNVADEVHPSQEIPMPPGLERLEICRSSGMRAVEACKHAGAEGDAPNTFTEWADSRQVPTGPCHIHGDGPAPVAAVDARHAGEWPKAVPVMDLSSVKPVAVQGPTLIGEDPYRAIATAQATAEAAQEAIGQQVIEVRRAEPVRPLDSPLKSPVLEVEAPPPLKF